MKLPGGRGYKLYMSMPFAEFVESVYEIPDTEANAQEPSWLIVVTASWPSSYATYYNVASVRKL